jgi:predicted nuclease with RNAse H fold
MPRSSVCGLDLAGSPHRPSGYAIANRGLLVGYGLAYSDDDILSRLKSCSLVAIDAPLSKPLRRGGYREVDVKLLRRGLRVLPLTLPGMRKLVDRALRLKALLESNGLAVIETHPRSAWLNTHCDDPLLAACSILRCPDNLTPTSPHVVDAIVAAAVAYAYKLGRADAVSANDGTVYLLPPASAKPHSLRSA